MVYNGDDPATLHHQREPLTLDLQRHLQSHTRLLAAQSFENFYSRTKGIVEESLYGFFHAPKHDAELHGL